MSTTDVTPLLTRAPDGTPVVSSETIAEGAGIQHASVLRMIDDNQLDFEEFGQLGFEIRPGYNNARVRVALLNEQQATLLMTFQRNTEQVRTFKKALQGGGLNPHPWISHHRELVSLSRGIATLGSGRVSNATVP